MEIFADQFTPNRRCQASPSAAGYSPPTGSQDAPIDILDEDEPLPEEQDKSDDEEYDPDVDFGNGATKASSLVGWLKMTVIASLPRLRNLKFVGSLKACTTMKWFRRLNRYLGPGHLPVLRHLEHLYRQLR